MRITMTAVTAPLTLVLALALTGCGPDERVEANTTITLGQHGLSFVVPKDFRQADDSLVLARIATDLERSRPVGEQVDDNNDDKGGKKVSGNDPAKAAATGARSDSGGSRSGAKGEPAVVARTPAQVQQRLLDSYEAYLIDPVTESSKSPDTVAVSTLTTPLTTGSGALLTASLAAVSGIGPVGVVNQSCKAGPVLRGTYQIRIGKDADGDPIEVSYETIQLGLDDASSLQVTVSSMDEDVARDLADTVVASLATTS